MLGVPAWGLGEEKGWLVGGWGRSQCKGGEGSWLRRHKEGGEGWSVEDMVAGGMVASCDLLWWYGGMVVWCFYGGMVASCDLLWWYGGMVLLWWYGGIMASCDLS
eukprot:1157731-Pelagomonas_calceolata.AAC.14